MAGSAGRARAWRLAPALAGGRRVAELDAARSRAEALARRWPGWRALTTAGCSARSRERHAHLRSGVGHQGVYVHGPFAQTNWTCAKGWNTHDPRTSCAISPSRATARPRRASPRGNQLNQVTSLLDNAIDAMDGAGQIRIRAAREYDRVVVEISDNGPGADVQRASNVLRRRTWRRLGPWPGHVYRIVAHEHRGDIQVSSAPGDTLQSVPADPGRGWVAATFRGRSSPPDRPRFQTDRTKWLTSHRFWSTLQMTYFTE